MEKFCRRYILPRKLTTRQEMLHTSAVKPWEVVLDGEKGRDIVGAFPCWKDAHKALRAWLQDFRKGEINEEDLTDVDPISDAAKMEDQWALKDLKNAVEDMKWSFRFRHDKTKYTVTLQPVGFKED